MSNLQPGCRGGDVVEAARGECCHVCGFSIDREGNCDCKEGMDMTYREAFCELSQMAAQRSDIVALTVECWIRPAGSPHGVRGLVRTRDESDLKWQIYSKRAGDIFSAPTAREAIERYRLGLRDDVSTAATAANLRLVGDCNVD